MAAGWTLGAAPHHPGMDADTLLAAAKRAGGLTETEAGQALDAILGSRLAPEQGAELLVAMRQRGETAAELTAWVRGLLARATPVETGRTVIDIVGTGGSGRARYNASSTAAFILAAAGVPVAKHGNKGSARPNGSFDLLEALGIPVQFTPAQHRQLLDDSGICFLFARLLHPAVAAAAPMRKLAAARVNGSIFNLAGPLANPTRPVRLLIGSAKPEQATIVASTVRALGVHRALVVCGHPGIDEVSVTGPTRLWEVIPSGVRERTLAAPANPADESTVSGGDAPDNAAAFHRLLAGAERGPLLDYVCANAGAALACWHDGDPADARFAAQARDLVLGGKALAAFTRHRATARRLAGLAD
jgi:anthranilate phosphoribosyltransferase